MNRSTWIAVLALAAQITACGAPLDSVESQATTDSGSTAAVSGKADYFGEDDRKEPADESLPEEAVRWARSTALLVDEGDLEEDERGLYLDSKTLGSKRRLCGDDPYYYQPSVGGCSSFLVADDIMVTAGHCADNSDFCEEALFVFDYGFFDEMPRDGAPIRDENDPTRVTEDQLYRCGEIIDFIYEGNDIDEVDYAIVRLDRPVTDRAPLTVRSEGRLAEGDSVTLIGNSDGLPVKIDMGGEVIHADETRFISTSDTFASNSGSVVINTETGEVEAVHVSSSGDRYETQGACKYAKQCDEAQIERGECQGAAGVYADVWRDVLFDALDE